VYFVVGVFVRFFAVPKDTNDINDLMEICSDVVYLHMNGCIENNDEAVIVSAIDKFIDKYDLLEFGFSNDTLPVVLSRKKTVK
jgi:hypothetical protein